MPRITVKPDHSGSKCQGCTASNSDKDIEFGRYNRTKLHLCDGCIQKLVGALR